VHDEKINARFSAELFFGNVIIIIVFCNGSNKFKTAVKRRGRLIPTDRKLVYYQALIDKKSEYEGIFYVGVKTTGVFCRPTCPARKEKNGGVEEDIR